MALDGLALKFVRPRGQQADEHGRRSAGRFLSADAMGAAHECDGAFKNNVVLATLLSRERVVAEEALGNGSPTHRRFSRPA